MVYNIEMSKSRIRGKFELAWAMVAFLISFIWYYILKIARKIRGKNKKTGVSRLKPG
jgi:hypothetical protein